MKAINARLGDQALTEARLERQFLHWWPELDKQINSILEQQMAPSEKPARSSRELLEEILTIVRESQKNEQYLKIYNGRPALSIQMSKALQRLTKLYTKTVKDFNEENINIQLIIHNLQGMVPIFMDIIPFIQLARQEKQELLEEIKSLNFNGTSPFDNI